MLETRGAEPRQQALRSDFLVGLDLVDGARVLDVGCGTGVYATTTVALGDHDPLQRAVDAMVANSVTDRWLMRRIVSLVRASGFESIEARSLGYLDTADGQYMLTIVDRGVDLLQAQGQLGDDAAAALRADARRRVKDETFFGHIAYVGLTARRGR